MQVRAADDLKRLVTDRLADAGLFYEAARAFATPRRLAVVVDGVPPATADAREERKGPRADAPDKAVEGFLRSTGLARDALEVRPTDKGDVLFAVLERPGRPAAELVAEIVPDVVRGFPWPKSMRWGAGSMRWVRPLHSVLCVFDGAVVPFSVDGIVAGDTTRGHRFLAPEPVTAKHFEDYVEKLRAGRVVLDADERKGLIVQDAKKALFLEHLELVEDAGLLDEVAGLVEWPVPLVGRIDEAFLDLPPEVLTTTMRAHQRYFSARDPKTGELSNRFVVVANIPGEDDGRAIVAGNERVLRARLSDARFFWDQDRQVRLEDRLPALDGVVFHARLGSMRQKVERIAALAREIAPLVGADPDKAERAATLAKADLTSGMVGEFPELQGKMGRYYALHDGEDVEVADAIRDHYAPLGPSDQVPTAPVSIAVALADKIDTLVGFWAIDEKPTGSKDPYALRRAALGVIRIVLENSLRLRAIKLFGVAAEQYSQHAADGPIAEFRTPVGVQDLGILRELLDDIEEASSGIVGARRIGVMLRVLAGENSLSEFFADRLKVHLREQGVRHDLIAAVFSLGGQDDLVLLVRRVEALQAFLATDDGANLLTAYRRASNILRIEEKKDGCAFDGEPDHGRFVQDEETVLADRLAAVAKAADAAIASEDFSAAMAAMAGLRGPVDAFFDRVTVNTVNADDRKLRENRLKLLSRIRATLSRVADFAQIEG